MISVICTLFEHHYHCGVASLGNLFYLKGFRGYIFAGNRGELPFRANKSDNDNLTGLPNAKVLEIDKELKLYFLPINTNYISLIIN
jgi:hypothetical protein